jgi:hypothetical protein
VRSTFALQKQKQIPAPKLTAALLQQQISELGAQIRAACGVYPERR